MGKFRQVNGTSLFPRSETSLSSSPQFGPAPASVSATSSQPVPASAYLYQHSSTTRFLGVTGHSHMSTPAVSYPGIWQQDITRSSENRSPSLGAFTLTVTDHGTAHASTSMMAHANAIIPVYPSLSANLVQGTPPHILNQGHCLHLAYQQGSQVCHSSQGAMRLLLSGKLGPCLQTYGCASYTGSGASAPQPEIVMVLKEAQPINVTPVSTSLPCTSLGLLKPEQKRVSKVSTKINKGKESGTEASLDMETSLGLQALSLTECLPQPPGFSMSCSSRTPVKSSTHLLPLAPSQEQPEKNRDEMETKLSKPLDAYQILIGEQDLPLLPLAVPDPHKLLAPIKPLSQETPGSEDAHWGKNSLTQGYLTRELSLAHVGQMLLPSWRTFTFPSFSTPWMLLTNPVIPQPSEPKMLDEVNGCRRQAKGCEQARTKRTRENNYRKAQERKPSRHKVKAEEKPTIPNMKHKRNQPAFGQEVFKKPHSCLGVHMLELVQVFHALGKKTDKRAGLFSSQALGTSSSTKNPKPLPPSKPWLGPCEGKGPNRAQVSSLPHSSPKTEAPSPSLRWLPPPGKVKLIPLPFPGPDKPQGEPVATAVTKHQSLHRPQNQFLLQDFHYQPIPWREPSVHEPVMSTPVTKEQRPGCEAMKRQAQQERELAAKHTSLGKLQFFRQREKDREVSQY
ncbi:LOW QUALITY PROTEIN: uncharacterized protein C2orf78 homolog [Erethizon dorsatum]